MGPAGDLLCDGGDTVAGVAAESPFALELAREWIESESEFVAACGWNTYANHISITPDDALPMEEISGLLQSVQDTIKDERNRVKYVMNGFVIAVGTYVVPLHVAAMMVAQAIGAVPVHMGDTACKVPLAEDYIDKASRMGKIGAKKKTCIC